LKRFIKGLFLFAIGVVVIAYAVANRQPVQVIVDPFIDRELAASFEAPLFLLLFGALFVGLIVGAASAWLAQRHWRKRARAEQRQAARWQREAENLKRGLQASSPAPQERALSSPR
jgi:uncharacterized integral membrane protein